MRRNGEQVVGFGNPALVAPAAAASPWPMVIATSVVSAVTGLVVEEFARKVRKRRR